MEPSRLLAPTADISFLSGPETRLLDARSLASLLSASSFHRRALLSFEQATQLLRHRWIGGLSALAVSAQSRHVWRHAMGDESTLASRLLHWLHCHETALFFETFQRSQIHPEHISQLCILPGLTSDALDNPEHSGNPALETVVASSKDQSSPPRSRMTCVWREFGPLEDNQNLSSKEDQKRAQEVRRIEGVLAPDETPKREEFFLASRLPPHPSKARCLSLRICGMYPISAEHFGRGVTCKLAHKCDARGNQSKLLPSEVSFLFRLSLDLYGGIPFGKRRPAKCSAVGHFVISDGNQYSPAPHDLFGAEGVHLFFSIGPNHSARLLAIVGEGITRVVHNDVRNNAWLQLRCRLDWGRQETRVSVSDFDSASWGDLPPRWVTLPFRAACSEMGQMSFFSLGDSGHARVSWTNILVVQQRAAGDALTESQSMIRNISETLASNTLSTSRLGARS